MLEIFSSIFYFNMKKFIKIFLIFAFCMFANAGDLNFDKITNEAKKSDKNILIFFSIEGCRFCEAMKKESFSDEKTLKYLKKHFLVTNIHIGDNKKDTILQNALHINKKEFAKQYEIFSYPSTVFLDKNAKVIYTSRSYKNADEFMILLKFIKNKKYKSMNLDDFTSEAEFVDE